ncbi:metallophosphoesterase [Microcoleus sp. FACHB-1515]|uniref:metallophosphoesterase n=1 Tax=Cyanophyceae TaxID=3028117 RepID=UPI0016863BB3|nr:metallophosphoesterase [Microcoleus sp. FACHB-1515]MBD2091864.1 metallophosphoesterase [Microcoleus sp. FACHB-1515]
MKLHILSDLHLEFEAFTPPVTNADAIVLAGDIHVGKKGVEWAKTHFSNKPVIYVLGNHEFYGKAFPKHVIDLKKLAEGTNIHILENDRLTLDGITFLGCTLWTDFNLYGNPKVAGHQATQTMSDYRKIRVSSDYRKLRSIDTAIIHNKSLQWLSSELSDQQNQPIVVITHHAPSSRSLPDNREDLLNAAYASPLDCVVEQSQAALWVHGHLHQQQDYSIGKTRVLCNPRGYPDERNPHFIPNLVVELSGSIASLKTDDRISKLS